MIKIFLWGLQSHVCLLQGLELRPEDITVLAGCGSVIDLLLHCITADGDSIGIPAPYYPAFDNDVKV